MIYNATNQYYNNIDPEFDLRIPNVCRFTTDMRGLSSFYEELYREDTKKLRLSLSLLSCSLCSSYPNRNQYIVILGYFDES